MIQEINEAIRRHPETTVNGLFGVAGIFLGSVLSLASAITVEWLRSRGKIKFKLESDLVYETNDKNDDKPTRSLGFEAELRLFNEYHSRKYLLPKSATFYARKHRCWQLRRRCLGVATLFSTLVDGERVKEVRCDGDSTNVIVAKGWIISSHKDCAKEWEWLEINFTVIPDNATATCWLKRKSVLRRSLSRNVSGEYDVVPEA